MVLQRSYISICFGDIAFHHDRRYSRLGEGCEEIQNEEEEEEEEEIQNEEYKRDFNFVFRRAKRTS